MFAFPARKQYKGQGKSGAALNQGTNFQFIAF